MRRARRIDCPILALFLLTSMSFQVPCGTAATSPNLCCFQKGSSDRESLMRFVTMAAVAALLASPALADPIAREQAKADFHQAQADAAKAQVQKDDAQAQAAAAQDNAASAQAQANASQADASALQQQANAAKADANSAQAQASASQAEADTSLAQ